MSEYQGPERRQVKREEAESKLTLESRSQERAHSTEHSIDDEPVTEINVTPLVDVALCLVIIFMAVSPFMLQAGLVVSESKAGAATGKAALNENVQVTLSADGKVLVNSVEAPASDLRERLKSAIAGSKDGLVTLQADAANRVGQVVEVLDVAKQAGAKKVAILNKLGEEAKPAGEKK